MLIQETDHYILECDNNPYDKDFLQYLIKNKETQVIEADSRLLPMAKKYLLELESFYDSEVDINIHDNETLDMFSFDELTNKQTKKH